MASIVITIETGGAAFHPCDEAFGGEYAGEEIARILGVLCARLVGDTVEEACGEPLRDTNGVPCGKVELIE